MDSDLRMFRDLLHALRPEQRRGAVFVMSRSTAEQFGRISLGAGWDPRSMPDQGNTLLGRSVLLRPLPRPGQVLLRGA